MSAHPALPLVLSRTTETLDRIILQTAPTELSRLALVAHTTIPRRGSDLGAWPYRDLKILEAHYPELRTAAASWHVPDVVQPSLLVETHCREVIQAMGMQIGTLMGRLEDNLIDVRDAEATDRELAKIEDQIASLRQELQARKALRP